MYMPVMYAVAVYMCACVCLLYACVAYAPVHVWCVCTCGVCVAYSVCSCFFCKTLPPPADTHYSTSRRLSHFVFWRGHKLKLTHGESSLFNDLNTLHNPESQEEKSRGSLEHLRGWCFILLLSP